MIHPGNGLPVVCVSGDSFCNQGQAFIISNLVQETVLIICAAIRRQGLVLLLCGGCTGNDRLWDAILLILLFEHTLGNPENLSNLKTILLNLVKGGNLLEVVNSGGIFYSNG